MIDDNQLYERANRLKLILKHLEIKGKTFAKAIGISQGMISNLLNGKRSITLELVDKITSRYTQINPAWLLFEYGTMLKTEEQDQNRLVSEPQATYEKPRPIALEDLANIIISIQEENMELRRRVEAIEVKLKQDETKHLP